MYICSLPGQGMLNSQNMQCQRRNTWGIYFCMQSSFMFSLLMMVTGQYEIGQYEVTFGPVSEMVEVGLSSLRKMVITGSVSTSSLVATWRGDMIPWVSSVRVLERSVSTSGHYWLWHFKEKPLTVILFTMWELQSNNFLHLKHLCFFSCVCYCVAN